MDRDTVAALSTPPGRGGIAVIRVSGAETKRILSRIIEKYPKKPIHAKASHSYIIEGEKRIEECLWTLFKSPMSYTGEDLAEISIHSNPFLIERVLELIIKNGARQAMPGEFTYRAFKNGKMDLIQAESVNELINANSGYYAEMKFGNLDGIFSEFLYDIKENLVQTGIKIETMLEFQEDQNLGYIEFSENLKTASEYLEKIISNHRMNELFDKGRKIVIVGKVNVGKSSLFNRLLMEDRSITSSEPGTTRDFIREKIYPDGIPLELIDVAGLNSSSSNEIEKDGIERGKDIIDESDMVVFILDAETGIDENDIELYKLIKKKKHIIVLNKTDLPEAKSVKEISMFFNSEEIIPVSVLKNKNIETVFTLIKDRFKITNAGDITVTVNLRQKDLLSKLNIVLQTIRKNVDMNKTDVNPEIVAEEIREALLIIGKLLGKVTDDDILNGIFSGFCIGK